MTGPEAASYRRLAPEDWETLRAVRLRALADAPEAFSSTIERELAFDEATWRSRCVTSAQFVAEGGGEVCGIAAGFGPSEAGEWQLVSMWVAPQARRRGVGAALVQLVIGHVRDEGARSLDLWVADDNAGARLLYERLGFAATGERDQLGNRPEMTESKMSFRFGDASSATDDAAHPESRQRRIGGDMCQTP
jgi:GNAT superfamily N-acetyltransferase